jgi:hypothetical protein
MKRNLGNTDKVIRILAAIVVAVLYFGNFISGTIALVFGLIAIIFVITSFINFCPLYGILGINTFKKNKS